MRYSQRPSAGGVVIVGSGAARSSLPPSPPRASACDGAPAPLQRQLLEVVLTWSGGDGVDLVKLVVDDAFRRPRDVRLESGRRRLALELDVDTRPTHSVELLVSFVGESRAELALRVYVDGRLVGEPPECERASQRWEVLWRGP